MLQLIKSKNIPVEGSRSGVVKKTEIKSGTTEDGEAYENLVVTVELDKPDANGNKFQVAKTFNLKGCGLATFRKDYKTWQNKKLTDAQLANFDADMGMT